MPSKTYRDFIFYRSYSRWNDQLGRRETWEESVDRYVNYMRSKLSDKISELDYSEIRSAILNQEVMPSMRLFWGAGPAVDRSNVVAYNCSFIAPQEFQDFGEILYILTCGSGVGFTVEKKSVERLPVITPQKDEEVKNYIIADSKEGWADALVLGMSSWYSGGDVNFDYSLIRPEGARLKTMGGRASGPAPLRGLLDFTRKTILNAGGRKLRPIEVHDIVCKIGDIVVSGGVRRSSEISLSDLDDVEMRDSKKDTFWIDNPHRTMSNNSAVYLEKPSKEMFEAEWEALKTSGTGERGIFNRGSLGIQMPERRKSVEFMGTNPCFAPGTLIVTKDGLFPIEELVGKITTIWDGAGWVEIDNFRITGEEQEILKITMHDGSEIKVTPEHSMILEDGTRIKAKQLSPDDRLMISRVEDTNGPIKTAGAYLKGFLTGDGTSSGDKPILWLYDTKYSCEDRLIQSAQGIPTGKINTTALALPAFIQSTYNRKMMQGLSVRKEDLILWTTEYKKRLPVEIFRWDMDSKLEFIAGVMDADGTAMDTTHGFGYQISSVHKDWLLDFQALLKTLGIQSTVRLSKSAGMRDFGDGYGEYQSKDCYRLTISQVGSKKLGSAVTFSRLVNLGNKVVHYTAKPRWNRVVSIESGGIEEKVYCCTVPETHSVSIGNGIVTGQCGEITLRPKQFCNLSEIVARPNDTKVSLIRKARIAAIIGTFQASLTNFGYLSESWKKNCEEEALLGVSITGQFDCPAVRSREALEALKLTAIETNRQYAGIIGINPSASVTCVKPSGTVSQLVDASSGMHPRFAPYFIRRVRISATDPLFAMLKDSGVPYKPETGQQDGTASTYVIEFPIKAPEGAITAEQVTALDQLEYWKLVKTAYTEHNPSCTIYVLDSEWTMVRDWLYDNWDSIGGLSFLPRDNNVYLLAPYEAITKEKYEELSENFPSIDYSKLSLYEMDDFTEGAKSLACSSGVCEIV